MKAETQVIHSGEKNAHFEGAVSIPIFQSANFIARPKEQLESASQGLPVAGNDYHQIRYIRLNNTPNHDVLHQKLADIEKGDAALVTASGMGAISTTFLAVLKPGDHLLAQECLYGGTLSLIQQDLSNLGISVSWINIHDPDQWKKEIKPNSKAIYVESISNPLTQVGALDTVAAFAKAHGLVSIIDNTVASPIYFQPLTLGFDIVVHSATKYLNGHSDIVAGAIVGSRHWIDRIKQKLDHFGAALDPHACFLLNRGMKTLALRMVQHQKNALSMAKFLEAHPKVKRVYYPGLESHPDHRTVRKLFSGFSGLLSFELVSETDENDGDIGAADRFIQRLRLPLNAPSLGGVETLITRPSTTSHLGVPREERMRIGINDHLIRVSLGIENTEDLIEDFREALE